MAVTIRDGGCGSSVAGYISLDIPYVCRIEDLPFKDNFRDFHLCNLISFCIDGQCHIFYK